jgi:hypothetical protein
MYFTGMKSAVDNDDDLLVQRGRTGDVELWCFPNSSMSLRDIDLFFLI